MFIAIGFLGIIAGDSISDELTKKIAPEYYASVVKLKHVHVYKTRTGERYHRSYHYSNRNSEVNLYSALKNGLTPCQVCKPRRASLPHREGVALLILPLRVSLSIVPFLLAYLIAYRKNEG